MNTRLLAINSPIVFCTILLSCSAADTNRKHTQAVPEGGRVLSGEEIVLAFSDVRDEAEIQDAAGTTAVNRWHSDGRFVNRWKNASESGQVSGSWRVVKDERCVLIRAGLEGAIGKEKCSPVFKVGDRYMSVNADGSVHAFHTLTPMLEKP